ncbi:hypothetical protein CTA2_10480 [Colletotrichum tanaceti]|uniref:Uncharacterized protein n=1 Tax=Colletotrichum tanaceti TaxID=1306861 RepID=A0A4U6XB15_9PEZI|nr:hypothetical protein CTA2_10480 [Colletotrichum tanaceti]TKW52735.1 hypothetical protein CTA1_11231 [Colletotrichum tanaceti]
MLHTAPPTFLAILLPLVLAAPHISPRENGCEIGATPVPSVTYTLLAPVRTVVIDTTQQDGCPWLADGSRPTVAPAAASPDPSSPGSNPPGRIILVLDPSPDGQSRDPAPTAGPDGSVPGGPGGGGQPSPSPAEISRPTGARSGSIPPLDGNFGQGIPTGPTGPINPSADADADATANVPTSVVKQTRTSLPPESTGDRFVIFAGSSSRTFSVPSIRQGPVLIGLLALWVFVVMVS